MLKLFTVLINIPFCHTYKYGFNVIRYWYLILMLLQTNNVCGLQAHIPYFFYKPMGGVVADQVVQT